MYRVIKKFGHARGLSATFRQWRATHSHCQHLHGYALAVSFTFGAFTLDARQWVIDFGGFDEVKDWLHGVFDHKLLVAEDDPALEQFQALAAANLASTVILPNVGCEAFAETIHRFVADWLARQIPDGRVFLLDVTVSEHDGNSASYTDSALLGEPLLSELMRDPAGSQFFQQPGA